MNEQVSKRQYLFLCFLTLLNVLNFVDRQLISSFANFIVPDLGLSNTQFGLLTGFAFILFYAFMGLFMGALADLVHRPRLIAAGLTIWSLLTAASGAARGFVSLAIPRMLIGVGESALTPTSMSLMADRFPVARLGFASGFYYMGVPVGVGASLLIAGYLGPAIGWRRCFFLLGALGLLFSLILLFVKEVPRRGAHSSGGAKTPVPRPRLGEMAAILTRTLRNSPALTATIAGGVAYHFVLGAAAFDQLWFARERGFDRATIAQLSGWIGMAGGILGCLCGGFGGDWWLRRTGTGRPYFLFWIMLILSPISLAYRLVPAASFWFWAGIFVGYFKLSALYGPTFSTVQELAPPQIRGTIVAFYILMLNFIGLGFGITVGGIVVDRLIAAGVAQPYTWTLFGFTLLSLIAVPCFWYAGRHFARDRNRLHALISAASASGVETT